MANREQLACLDRVSRVQSRITIVLGTLDLLWGPGGVISSCFCVKETWPDPMSIFLSRPMLPSPLFHYQPVHPHSITQLSHTRSCQDYYYRDRPGLHLPRCGGLWARCRSSGDRQTDRQTHGLGQRRVQSALMYEAAKYSGNIKVGRLPLPGENKERLLRGGDV